MAEAKPKRTPKNKPQPKAEAKPKRGKVLKAFGRKEASGAYKIHQPGDPIPGDLTAAEKARLKRLDCI